MSIFVQAASIAVAQALKAAGVWVGWGTGSAGWDDVAVPEPINATALVAEIGRRRATTIDFAVADAGGDIIVPAGTFSISPTPTNILFVRCNFGAEDAVGQSIREAGVFIGTTLVGGLPVGQDYFVPANIAAPGTLMLLERFAKIVRTSDFSVSLQFILTL